MIKLIEENFKVFNEQINNVRKWEKREITKDFLVDAYVLAKAILEHYDYDPFNISTFTKLGLDIVDELRYEVSEDYCKIMEYNGDMYVWIKYCIIQEKKTVHKCIHWYTITSLYHPPKEVWFDTERDVLVNSLGKKYGEFHNNHNFYYAYALFSIILKKYNQNYVFGKETNKEEYIVEIVTLLALYIYGDYKYRQTKWQTTYTQKRDTRELPNVHIALGATKTKKNKSSDILLGHYLYSSYNRSPDVHVFMDPRDLIGSTIRSDLCENTDYWRELKLSKKVIDKMSKVVEKLNELEEYEKISQMKLTLSYFEKHKLNYRSFGKPFKLD